MSIQTKKGSRAAFIRATKENDTVLFSASWHPEPVRRTITVRQSNSVAFSHPTKSGENSWLDYPKASGVNEVEPGLFHIYPFSDSTREAMVYDFR